ncbi:MAG: M1 family metallopeptidase, partial [Rhodothermales bacterium]|nr:M1 family metallopeptidase [Rhodothermales bacterium]
MRRLYLLPALLLAACSASVQTTDPSPPAAVVEVPPLERPVRAVPEAIVLPGAFEAAIAAGTRTRSGAPGPNYWQQEADYTLEARLFPETHRLEGTARIRYTNRSPNPLPLLVLELAQNLHAEGALRAEPVEVTGGVSVERVVLDGQELTTPVQAPPGYMVDGTRLVLGPPAPIAPGATAELEIDWSFVIPQAGAGGRMGYSEDDLYFLAYWYPAMMVYDDVYGWFTDPFTATAEFYHGFGDYDLTVEAPEGWVVMATGALQNPEAVLAPDVAARMRAAHASDAPMIVAGPDDAATATSDDGRLRWRFTAENVRDVAFSATRASTWEAARTPVGDRDGDGQTEYTAINTFWRAQAPLWSEVTRYQQHSITFHSAFTGLPYPWPHMTAVEGAGIIGGGMEFPMMTLMGDYNARGDSALYNVTAHELAHMWIPMITGLNERRFAWMDEGATTFLENQARKDFYPGPDHERGDRDNYLNVARAEQEGEIMRWSNFHYPGPSYGIASYSKPGTLLSTLRAVLGEETFMRGYRMFIDRWAYKHPYPYDLFNTFEDAAGRDLDWFWHSWYFETWTLDQAVAGVTMDGGRA